MSEIMRKWLKGCKEDYQKDPVGFVLSWTVLFAIFFVMILR